MATYSATDVAGNITTMHVTVTINNVVPDSVVIHSASVTSPEGTEIDVTGTAHDVGPDDNANLGYTWDVSKNCHAGFADGSGTSFHFTPDDNGTYTITLTVSDDHTSTISTATVNVTNVAPTPTINGAPASSPEGTAISLTSTVTDPSTVDTGDGFTYLWHVTKNGVSYGTDGTSANYTFTPDDGPSTFVVYLTATDKDGGSNTTSQTINVTDVPPTIVVTDLSNDVSTASSPEGSSFTLKLGAITDPGTDTVTQYLINWGDGTFDDINDNRRTRPTRMCMKMARPQSRCSSRCSMRMWMHTNAGNSFTVNVQNVAPQPRSSTVAA